MINEGMRVTCRSIIHGTLRMRHSLYRNAALGDCCDDWLPWAWCNLRRNPFGELTREERALVAVADTHVWTTMLRKPRVAIQFIGRKGRGKTTRMLALQRALPDASYTYIPETGPCPPIAWGRPILIDEAQRLPATARAAVLASSEPLGLATHHDLTRPLHVAGYEVITYKIGRENNATLLRQWTWRRIEASRLSNSPVCLSRLPQLSENDSERLIRRFGTDFRAIENFLYDKIQTQCYSHGEMRFID